MQEERRQRMLAAAEKRQHDQQGRGIAGGQPSKLEERQKRIEKAEQEAIKSGNMNNQGGLRVSACINTISLLEFLSLSIV